MIFQPLNVSSQFKPNLKDFIEDEYSGMDNSDAISKAKKFYKSCMKQGMGFLFEIFKNELLLRKSIFSFILSGKLLTTLGLCGHTRVFPNYS